MKVIEIKDLIFNYEDMDASKSNDYAINGINLSIEEGEFVTILGHNGSGKSTLSKLIVGLLKATSGEISIFGTKLTEESVYELRKHIGIVFQNPDNQFVGVTVKDDIAFGLENKCISPQEMEELINKYSKLVNMNNFLNYNPENLSGGEKQRVAIAGALASNNDIIIFDESTSMLDPRGVNEVNELIKKLKGTKTIIVITHNLSEALISDRVIVLNHGKVVLNGTPKEVFSKKEILKESNLDILETMKLIELINNSNINKKEELEEKLWLLTFQK